MDIVVADKIFNIGISDQVRIFPQRQHLKNRYKLSGQAISVSVARACLKQVYNTIQKNFIYIVLLYRIVCIYIYIKVSPSLYVVTACPKRQAGRQTEKIHCSQKEEKAYTSAF